MAILLELVEGKVKSVGNREVTALMALRKEFIRRNIELNALDKIIQNYEKITQENEIEIEKYEESTILQYEYVQSLL